MQMTIFSTSLILKINNESNKLLLDYHRKFIRPEFYEHDYGTINVELVITSKFILFAFSHFNSIQLQMLLLEFNSLENVNKHTHAQFIHYLRKVLG